MKSPVTSLFTPCNNFKIHMKMNNKQAIYTDKVVQASVRLRVKSPGNGSTDRQLALKNNSMENSNINLMRTGFLSLAAAEETSISTTIPLNQQK